MARLRRMPREIYRVHDGEDFHDRADGEGERAEPGNTPWRSGPGLRRAAAAVAVLGAVGTVILHTRPVRDGIRVLVPSGGLHTADGSPPPGRHTFRNRRAPASSLSRSRPRYTPGSPVRRRQPPAIRRVAPRAGREEDRREFRNPCGAAAEFGFERCHE